MRQPRVDRNLLCESKTTSAIHATITMTRFDFLLGVSSETEVWTADEETHLNHLTGRDFLARTNFTMIARSSHNAMIVGKGEIHWL
jgi:hypothetical protein